MTSDTNNFSLASFRHILVAIAGIFSWLLPTLVFAQAQQQAAQQAASFVQQLNTIIIFPTIALLSAVAFLVFLWGCAEYFMGAANDQARQQGVKHITYGIIGLVIMVAAYAILTIATGTFGLDDQLKCADDPNASVTGGCANVFTI